MSVVPVSLGRQTLPTVLSLRKKRLMRCGGASLQTFTITNGQMDEYFFFSLIASLCTICPRTSRNWILQLSFSISHRLQRSFLTCRPMTVRKRWEHGLPGGRETWEYTASCVVLRHTSIQSLGEVVLVVDQTASNDSTRSELTTTLTVPLRFSCLVWAWSHWKLKTETYQVLLHSYTVVTENRI